MSFDLYLLPARIVGKDVDKAGSFIEREHARFRTVSDAADPGQKRALADLLLRLRPDFREFELDYAAIAEWEKTTIEESRRKYTYIEVNGLSRPAEAQFTFHDKYVAIRWYSGMPPGEMDAILYSLSVAGDFIVFDPQANQIVDLRE